MFNFFMLIGIISIAVSGIMMGAFLSGPEIRANFHTETKESRASRTKISNYTGLIGLLSFIIAGILRYFS